jgi:chemotaxis protein methyltransferase CheR
MTALDDPTADTIPAGNPEGEGSVFDPEMREILDALFERHGIDFRHYAAGYLRRRLLAAAEGWRLGSSAALRDLVLRDPAALARLHESLAIHTTAMFRDPSFHLALRARVVPVLRTYPFIRIWVAGCSTGEEAYSLAILLHEEGLLPRCRIYATDASERVLARARDRIFPLSAMRDYAENHRQAGGPSPLSDYYAEDGRNAILRSFLEERIVFAQHNLATDRSFNDFHLVLCRNVMIYFAPELQARVHALMRESLVRFGFLGLGKGESLSFAERQGCYEEIAPRERLYRKIN